jgi:hypothetical protein
VLPLLLNIDATKRGTDILIADAWPTPLSWWVAVAAATRRARTGLAPGSKRIRSLWAAAASDTATQGSLRG